MTALLLYALLAVEPGVATPPARIVNARVETRSAATGLAGVVRELGEKRREPFWIGYAVPSGGSGTMCCFDSLRSVGRCAGCRLEGGGAFFLDGRGAAWEGPVALERPRQVLVLYRVAKGAIERVRAFSADCALDAGGLTLFWLADVAPPDSLALLRSLVDAHDDEALAAIAEHADPGADAVLIGVARGARDPDLRGEALFWLAQKASRKAVGEIQRAILEDPETEVKKQAVFALSELPSDQGVPLLIDLARRHKNPVVREQAFFWLGESEDARAVAFFEEVLLGRR